MEQDFKVGQILNFSWDSIYGKVIKFYNYKEYGYSEENIWTHSSLISEIKGDDVIVYEALSKGFTKNTYTKQQLLGWIENGNMIVGECKYKLTNVKKTCEKYLGTPYGFLDIFNIGLYLIFKKYAFTISTGTKQLICSEVTARILYECSKKKVDFEIEFDKSFDKIAPIDLYYSSYIDWK